MDHRGPLRRGYIHAVTLRMRAIALAVLTLLPVLAGVAAVARAMRGPERHVCVCPIDADGHCQCPECIRLHVHDRSAAPPASHEHARDHSAVIASACDTAPHVTPAPAIPDPALPPDALEPPALITLRTARDREVVRAPDEPSSDLDVPPPRSA